MSDTNSTTLIELSPEQHAYIDGLRELADLAEAVPEANVTYGALALTGVHATADETALERMTRLAREFGGRFEKGCDEMNFMLTRHIGPHKLMLFTARENVCQRVVTGTRMVEKTDPAYMEDAPQIQVEEEIVEWVCPESLLAGVVGDEAQVAA